ncbi:MAG: NADH:ubiquinone reductase (Na(+)-transporting) subunit C [Dysgonamonadaceae bacterium]|jgi:Na+-transporting NADH:ubiquinone oxidoreductase subunit C|nr:NADH:ubiquinone reductase (Na(+)-transporting) subunit C [Dysgonamonadaceae bacterium]MDD3355965.1 NADH:ubiquinone reductase (Na(+)-transporting) subunit C [Dysgonamonadaceae bacterium]MDD3727478.1 NADH:ubiquinone reductase (Na(+)-transporting) subunit C [Dysgonamonadaceae bacterium]MDD4246138.1 NADH:ubiquinone reductase (Na(+)-transporting) subunit C [Dysgonamonadaceae bacterium]MDD4606129.1 NADH:ubiquinone reductase (Na(+)-transporting) subunit C [Dysgonamonadaceae bacterium]
MKTEKNTYTIIYASIMVLLVALGLSFTHQALSEKQKKNVEIDKMQQILRSLKIDAPTDKAQTIYNDLISDAYLIDIESGTKKETSSGTQPTDSAFVVNVTNREGFPIYEAEIDGDKKYILPMNGKGLWGPIWGYLAIDSNGSTVYGVDFGHDSETPGLGAEITTENFRDQFEGKELFKDGEFKSIAVVKKGKSVSNRDYVDGISGGTITSKGVDAMLYDSVGDYENFLKNLTVSK